MSALDAAIVMLMVVCALAIYDFYHQLVRHINNETSGGQEAREPLKPKVWPVSAVLADITRPRGAKITGPIMNGVGRVFKSRPANATKPVTALIDTITKSRPKSAA